MANSWCKIEGTTIVDGPRAWHDNTPPDDTWVPHRLVDPDHTINDNWNGSKFELIGNEVIETNLYSPKPAEQIQSEIEEIKARAAKNVAKAQAKIADPATTNKEDWDKYRVSWSLLTNITELSWAYVMPSEPREPLV